jgi:capsular polysaccharide export protein
MGADLIHTVVVGGRPTRFIYYDFTPQRPRDLLQRQIRRRDAEQGNAAIRRELVATGLTKYNVGAQPGGNVHRRQPAKSWLPGRSENNRRCHPAGAPGISTNLALLQAARAAHPTTLVDL